MADKKKPLVGIDISKYSAIDMPKFEKWIQSEQVGLAFKHLGEAAEDASVTMDGVRVTFEEAAKIMEQERIEEIKKIPLPACPVCGSTMRLVEPGEGKTWTEFFGCTRYTDGCRGSRNIMSMGVPSGFDEEYEAEMDDTVMLCPA